jgi:hypothetical protein
MMMAKCGGALRTSMRKLMLAAGALTLMTGLAQAAEDERKVSNPTAVVQSITADDIAGILREIGGADVSISDAGAEKVVSFNDGGVPFSIAITLCEKVNPGKCYAFAQLMMLEDKGYSYATLNTLNVDTVTLTLFKNEKDAYVGLARIEIVDGGVTRERLANAITWYVVEVHDALQKLTQQVVAGVSADGKTKTLAMDAAAPRPIKPVPEAIVHMTKAMSRLADKRPLRKLNVK